MTIIDRQVSFFPSANSLGNRSRSGADSSFPMISDDQPSAHSQSTLDTKSSFSKLAGSLWSIEADGAMVSSASRPELESDLASELHKWANMDVGEKIRAQYLASRGLSEDDLANMSADDRKAIEDDIKKAIKEASGANQAEQETAMQLQSDLEGNLSDGGAQCGSDHSHNRRQSPERDKQDKI